MIDSRKLRFRPMLQTLNLVDNGRGGRKAPPGEARWKNVGKVWAEIIQLRGDEAQRNSVERSIATWRVTVRVRAGITTADRFVWVHPLLGTLHLGIKAVGLNDSRDGLVMTCTSGEVG